MEQAEELFQGITGGEEIAGVACEGKPLAEWHKLPGGGGADGRGNLNLSPGSQLFLTPPRDAPKSSALSEQMGESERNADDHTSGRTPHRRPRLMDRAMRERWAIPCSLRLPLVERLGEIVRDPEAPHHDVLSAVSAILTASKINLANIALSIKVQTHEELDERVTEIERKVGLGKAELGGQG